MHLSESIHFRAITVGRGRRRCAHLSQKHGALFSAEVSFSPQVSGWRAERHFFFFISAGSSYFITSLFTWSKKQVVYSSSRRYHISPPPPPPWSWIYDSQLKRKGNIWRFKFSLEVPQWQEKKKNPKPKQNMGICGYLAVPGKCFVVLGLKLLFLVPAGVPARSGDSVLKDNITVRQGDSAVLKWVFNCISHHSVLMISCALWRLTPEVLAANRGVIKTRHLYQQRTHACFSSYRRIPHACYLQVMTGIRAKLRVQPLSLTLSLALSLIALECYWFGWLMSCWGCTGLRH